MHCCWTDIDFDSKTVTVRDHAEYGFTVKDREERAVPLPDTLIEALHAKRRIDQDGKLVFPNIHGKPNGHFLRELQAVAKRANLPGQWGLHRFRRTFATIHHQAGVDARSIQAWLGHSDLETTLRYLAVADIRSERVRQMVNRSFQAVA